MQGFVNQTFIKIHAFLPQNTWQDIYVPLIFSHITKLLVTKKKSNLFFYILNAVERVEKNYLTLTDTSHHIYIQEK